MKSDGNSLNNRTCVILYMLLCFLLVLLLSGCARTSDAGVPEDSQTGESIGSLQEDDADSVEGNAGDLQDSAVEAAEEIPVDLTDSEVSEQDGAGGEIMEQTLLVGDPRVNYMASPQGLDSLPLWFSWEPPFVQEAYEITIEKDGSPVWQSGRVQSDRTINVPCDGRGLESHCTYQYSIAAYDAQGNAAHSEKASFSTAYLDGGVFEGSKFICLPDGMKSNGEGQGVYGKAFEIPEGEIERAWFYGSALGIYEAWINGVPIGEYLWKPGWTDYRKTLLYNTFDITDAVKQGKTNILTSMVNGGWWNGENAFGTYGTHKPAFICEILVCYTDGSKYRMGTDESWSCGTGTDIRYADFFQGETCDLRLPAAVDMMPCEAASVTAPDETVLNEPVGISSIFKGKFKSAWMEGVKAHESRTFSPSGGYIYEGTVSDGTTYGTVNRVEEALSFPLTLQPGQTLLADLGQNIAGISEITFFAEEGTQINLQFAEMLNDRGERSAGNDGPAGSLYRENYRAARTEVKVTASGKEEQETYRPVFFFTGFRYLTVDVSETTVICDLKGIGTGNASPEIGTIVTDHEKLNRLFENVQWSQRNNFTMIATDCPQRDERLGWMGDLQSFCTTSLYNQDLYSFYRKWEQDLADAQRSSGAYTDTAPSTANTGAGNAGWAEAGILVPWNVYRMYGNTEQLETLFDSMTCYMDYLEKKSDFVNGPVGGGTAYGDWLSKEKTDKHFLAALWYGEDALIMQKIAAVLGKNEEAEQYEALYRRIADFVKVHYLGQPDKLSQTEMCFLLKYGFLEEQADLYAQVSQSLQESVERNGHLLMTGFAGTPILLQTLTNIGRSDLAYRVLTAEGNPSWLYSVNQGATTIWERYDSYTLERGFASAAMNSFDHFNEGSVAQWMYECMAGISVDMDREIPIRIKPFLPPEDVKLHEVKGAFHSVYGEIAVSWKLAGENVEMDVTIPAGAQAEVDLPVAGAEAVVLSGGTYHFEGKRK